MRALSSCIALGLLLAIPSEARASNEDDFFPGSRAAMTAGAVTATVADGSATYFNPAGLAGSTGTRIDVPRVGSSLRY